MSPRTGRPKSGNAREIKVDTRLSDQESEKLEYCCKVLRITKAEVVRKGINKVYDEVILKEGGFKDGTREK